MSISAITPPILIQFSRGKVVWDRAALYYNPYPECTEGDTPRVSHFVLSASPPIMQSWESQYSTKGAAPGVARSVVRAQNPQLRELHLS